MPQARVFHIHVHSWLASVSLTKLACREIIDESDVYIDVHKAIRRMAPAPKARYQRRSSHNGRHSDGDDGKSSEDTKIGEEDTAKTGLPRPALNPLAVAENGKGRERSGSPLRSTVLLRRSSANIDGRLENVPVRANFDDIKQHLKHLGPSNRASNPKVTKSTTVKIKPGVVVHDEPRSHTVAEEAIPEVPRYEEEDEPEDDETTSLLRAVTPKDGAHALAQSYGATSNATLPRSFDESPTRSALQAKAADTAKLEEQATQTSAHASTTDLPAAASTTPGVQTKKSTSSSSDTENLPETSPYGHRKSLFARSGSITEQVVETRGIKKTVLGMTSSNEDEDESRQSNKSGSRASLPSGVLPLIEAGDEEGSGSGSPTTPSPSNAEGDSPTTSTGGNQNGAGNGAGKKKTRRKKKKGGKP